VTEVNDLCDVLLFLSLTTCLVGLFAWWYGSVSDIRGAVLVATDAPGDSQPREASVAPAPP
jgi:hypothetical protein